MRGLIIRSPWIEDILAGRKTWEIRGKFTTIRERIALIKGGAGKVVGTAKLSRAMGPKTLKELNDHQDKHCVPAGKLAEFVKNYDGRRSVVLEDVQLWPSNPYSHPSAVTWVSCRHIAHQKCRRALTRKRACYP